MGLAIVSMIVLAIMALVAVPVFGRVAGVATRRNENRAQRRGLWTEGPPVAPVPATRLPIHPIAFTDLSL